MIEVRKKQNDAKVAALAAEFKSAISAKDRDTYEIPVVENWKKQYQHAMSRYRFLILQGESRFGKTKYATKLFGSHRTLVIDCSNGKVPDLREFDPVKHRCVILDEMPLKSVMVHKRVIQAPAEEVTLGSSETQMHAYRKFFGRAAFVVTTNKFYDDWKHLDNSDKDWIVKNSFIVIVKRYLYERDASEEKAEQVDYGWTHVQGLDLTAFTGPALGTAAESLMDNGPAWKLTKTKCLVAASRQGSFSLSVVTV